MKHTSRYPLSVILLHWLLAAGLIANVAIGWLLDDNQGLMELHKSLGIAIFGLVLIRCANRLLMQRTLPESVNPSGSLAYYAEKSVHGLLYILMLAIPLFGWLKTNAAGHPASFFGWFALPDIVGKDRTLSEWFGDLHSVAAYGLAGVVACHVVAVIGHSLFTSGNVLRRMWPRQDVSGRPS